MKIFNRIKKLRKLQVVNLILLLIIIILSTTLTVFFALVPYSIMNTIETVQIPSGHYVNEINPTNLRFEISFSIENKGFSDISDFSINISEKVIFHEKNNNSERKTNIFQKHINFGRIPFGKAYSGFINGSYDDFEIEALNNLWVNMNDSKPILYFIDIKIAGKFIQDLIPFRIEFKDVCLSCLNN